MLVRTSFWNHQTGGRRKLLSAQKDVQDGGRDGAVLSLIQLEAGNESANNGRTDGRNGEIVGGNPYIP